MEAFLIILPEILLQTKPVQHLELTIPSSTEKSINLMRALKSIFIDQSFATITVSNELSFIFDLSSTIGIDLSRNLLHREIPTGFSGLLSLEYLNLSYNYLDSQLLTLEKTERLMVLDLSDNSLSGQILENVSNPRIIKNQDMSS